MSTDTLFKISGDNELVDQLPDGWSQEKRDGELWVYGPANQVAIRIASVQTIQGQAWHCEAHVSPDPYGPKVQRTSQIAPNRTDLAGTLLTLYEECD
jgi:hypothetical protein